MIPGGVDAPPAPKGMLKDTRDKWDTYWRSGMATIIESDTDLAGIERLFTLYDERLRAHRAYRKNPMVAGSAGQPRVNPMWGVIQDCDKEIRVLEDRYGLNPKARINLGMRIAETAKTLDDINAQYRDE